MSTNQNAAIVDQLFKAKVIEIVDERLAALGLLPQPEAEAPKTTGRKASRKASTKSAKADFLPGDFVTVTLKNGTSYRRIEPKAPVGTKAFGLVSDKPSAKPNHFVVKAGRSGQKYWAFDES